MITGLAWETLRLGIRSIALHKLRSFLTTLGIICGVAAVICMLSIGEGASEAELALIRLLGTQNVIVRSVKPEETTEAGQQSTRMLSYGLTEADLRVIRGTIPGIRQVVPLREVAFEVSRGPVRAPARVLGAEPAFFGVVHVAVARGRAIQAVDERERAGVCVIGDDLRARLFAYEDPLGSSIWISTPVTGMVPYRVVGVLERVRTAGAPARGIGERDLNNDVFIPLATAEARYGNLRVRISSGSREYSQCDYSDFYIQAETLEHVLPVSEMVKQVLVQTHARLDYDVRVPLERLRIVENEKRRRQITLGCIAGISLLVGGIGIMNIMLASVTERTREIGIRRALGAKRRHITLQFLAESVVLSTVGGLIGIACGTLGALLITRLVGWPTVIHEWTIVVSFGLAMAVGVFFGIYPASSAARLDPIEALRYE